MWDYIRISIRAKFKRLLLDRYRAFFYNIDIIGFKYIVIIYKDLVDTITFIPNKVSFNYLFFP